MSEFMYDELDSMELADTMEDISLDSFVYDYATDDDDLHDLLSFD